MTYTELTNNFKGIVDIEQVKICFPDENDTTIRQQLSRFEQRGKITRLKRGTYWLGEGDPDILKLANTLYEPSYISLEFALNFYGVMPDVPAVVTSVTTIKPLKINTDFGNFSYSKLKRDLYFGETIVKDIRIATPEKALLDFLYIREISSLGELRLDIDKLHIDKFNEFKTYFPEHIAKLNLLDI